MIVPTIGRVIHVYRNGPEMPPEPALICYVHNDRKINVAGFSYTGDPFSVRDCTLVQDDEAVPNGIYAIWMPYQVNKAASSNALASAVAQAESAAAVPAAVAPKAARSKTISPAEASPTETPVADPKL